MTTTPRLLLVACQFPPDATVATRRAARIATAMRDRGWTVEVLASHPRFAAQLDPALLDGLAGITVHHAEILSPRAWAKLARETMKPATPAAHAAATQHVASATTTAAKTAKTRGLVADVGAAARAALRAVSNESYRHLAVPDAYVGWFAPATLIGSLLQRPDVVLATLPPPTAALVGAALADRFSAPLVLDYRDPWTARLDHAALPRWRAEAERSMEAAVLRRAAGVAATTHGIAEDLQRRGAHNVVWIPNACEPERFSDVTPRIFATPTLVYTGGIYGGRSLLPTLRSMARLRASGRPTPRLCYLGTTGAEVAAEAALAGVSDLVDIDGAKPSHEALAATAGAIANVCIVADVHARQIPAKLFEQITAGRPLVLLTPLPSDAADLLQGVSDAVILRHGDEAGLDNALARLASATRRQPRAVAGAVPAHLTVTATMDALETLLRGAIGAKRIHATTQRQS